MSSDLTSPRNVGIGATLAPLMIVGALVLMNGASEPHIAAADVQAPPDPELMLIASMGGLSQAQEAAIAFREQIPAMEAGDSPFPLAEIIASRAGEIDPDLNGPAEPLVEEGPSLNVTAIMGSKAGNIALINGKAHRAGDSLGDGWTILSIDAQLKHVLVTDGAGEPLPVPLNAPTILPGSTSENLHRERKSTRSRRDDHRSR